MDELLLLELDLLELLFEPDALFFELLELPDLVGMGTLPSGALQPLKGWCGSGEARFAPCAAGQKGRPYSRARKAMSGSSARAALWSASASGFSPRRAWAIERPMSEMAPVPPAIALS